MTVNFVARENELEKLEKAASLPKSSFIAKYGRRRIGKTETILHFCHKNNLPHLEFTGKFGESRASQIKSFLRQISKKDPAFKTRKASDWLDAFSVLEDFLDSVDEEQKFVVFIDELPWLDTRKSGLMPELADFWNKYASRKANIILIVCGSAASYMLKEVISNKGSLHGRLTHKIPMRQFNLHDTQRFLSSNGCKHYSIKSITDIYMALGGVAKYLQSVDCSLTPSQAIQEICFKQDGLLVDEYNELYTSLFNKAQIHLSIMNILSQRWSGLTAVSIASLTDSSETIVHRALSELVASGFVSESEKFGNKKKDKLYAATDFFSYFYNRWMSGSKKVTNWEISASSHDFSIWSGYAFEKLCHSHIYQIKKALGINGVPTTSHYWSYNAKDKSEKGAQIDLLLYHDNNSRNVDIIECKYYDSPFTITKEYKEKLNSKRQVFNETTNNRYNTRVVIVSPYGVKTNEHYNEISPNVITLKDLFEPEP